MRWVHGWIDLGFNFCRLSEAGVGVECFCRTGVKPAHSSLEGGIKDDGSVSWVDGQRTQCLCSDVDILWSAGTNCSFKGKKNDRSVREFEEFKSWKFELFVKQRISVLPWCPSWGWRVFYFLASICYSEPFLVVGTEERWIWWSEILLVWYSEGKRENKSWACRWKADSVVDKTTFNKEGNEGGWELVDLAAIEVRVERELLEVEERA